MIKTLLSVNGMKCEKCEARVNEAIRSAFPVKKVTSSHTAGETVILSETAPDETALRSAVEALGFVVTAVSSAPEQKKGFRLFRS